MSELTDAERIKMLTRGYMAVVNYTFNSMHDKTALFELVMDAKKLADEAIDRDTREEVFAEIAALPGNRTHFCDECGASVNVDLQRN